MRSRPGGHLDVAVSVLDWYRSAARDLPWRRANVGPWDVLVSEVMLQQTPVSRVLPAWVAWTRRWPTPASLAAEAPGEAVRMWGRLGYPRRALRLHESARLVEQRHGGRVPADLDALLALPGVGRYTACAVASFAFRRRHAVLDTNVARLLGRLFGDDERATDGRQRDRLDRLLPEDPETAAQASVAFMELGALVCTARNPGCAACPVRAACCAYRTGGLPAHAPSGPVQGYRGTVREARGFLLGALRQAEGAVGSGTLALACPDAARRSVALQGLLADGLVRALDDGTSALP